MSSKSWLFSFLFQFIRANMQSSSIKFYRVCYYVVGTRNTFLDPTIHKLLLVHRDKTLNLQVRRQLKKFGSR